MANPAFERDSPSSGRAPQFYVGAAVQSNEVYPPPAAPARSGNSGRAADKRFSLGIAEHILIACP